MSKDVDQILFDVKFNNPSNLNFTYLNINSVRNKFENFKEIVNGNVDIFTIAETKLDGSFPTSQFELEGYYSPFRLDITKQSGGLLVYIKSSILQDNFLMEVFAILYKLFHLRSIWDKKNG